MPSLASAPSLRARCCELFTAAVDAVEPSRLVRARLERDGDHARFLAAGRAFRWPLPITVVGAGKPAAAMAAGAAAALGAGGVRGGVVTADGCAREVPGVEVLCAGHPLPDARGVRAAERILAAAHSATHGLLVLLGGGASSLLVQPRAPLTLDEKIATTRHLLACGAGIDEVNAVRKHLSTVKGGGLSRAAPAAVVTFALSDVVGNDLATIGSGPAVADPTSFADALAVLDRYDLRSRVPTAVKALLEAGASGLVEETLEPGDEAANRAVAEILADNGTALAAAAAAARRSGWPVDVVSAPLMGDVRSAADALARRLLPEPVGPRCLLAGGETTVVVRGGGRGGRNQELALTLAGRLAGTGWVVLCAGTDGIDGPTDAAGAIVDGATAERGRDAGVDLRRALEENDSYGFFTALGEVFRPGPTGTNVMDLVIALHPGTGGADG